MQPTQAGGWQTTLVVRHIFHLVCICYQQKGASIRSNNFCSMGKNLLSWDRMQGLSFQIGMKLKGLVSPRCCLGAIYLVQLDSKLFGPMTPLICIWMTISPLGPSGDYAQMKRHSFNSTSSAMHERNYKSGHSSSFFRHVSMLYHVNATVGCSIWLLYFNTRFEKAQFPETTDYFLQVKVHSWLIVWMSCIT